MKKKWILIVLTICVAVCSLLALGCKNKPESTPESEVHVCTPKRQREKKATCLEEGHIDHYACDCGKLYSDIRMTSELSREEVYSAKLSHKGEKTEATPSTCEKAGNIEYWTCSLCKHTFADADCTTEKEKSEFYVAKLGHKLSHIQSKPVSGKENGVKEHWFCSTCEGYFADVAGTEKITKEDVILYSVLNVPDFVISVPSGRDPVILQLTDTQIIDAGQSRPGRDSIDKVYWATGKAEERCYKYVRETINATNPDLILVTGDIVYGEFDDNGSAFASFVTFMDSFDKPWAPIFGNHDNESKKGVDWQCQQFKDAENCLFDQKTLSGNGNYSVGIEQDGKLTRVFYMLDTVYCGNASSESLSNGHTYNDRIGFQDDQRQWYKKEINLIKELSPSTKISFAYHIQQSIFITVLAQYGYSASQKPNIVISSLQNRNVGDFGYIAANIEDPWDRNGAVYREMKTLGVDSVFVGHEHSVSASIVYEGIRFQFGQKSSEYDCYNYVDANGKICQTQYTSHPEGTTPLIGGSVVVLDKNSGAISNAYIYYCNNAGGQIDWSTFGN